MDFKSWSNTKGVVTFAIENNARQPSSISLIKTRMNVRVCWKVICVCVYMDEHRISDLSLFPSSIAFVTASGGSIHSIIPDSSGSKWCSCICPLSTSMNHILTKTYIFPDQGSLSDERCKIDLLSLTHKLHLPGSHN